MEEKLYYIATDKEGIGEILHITKEEIYKQIVTNGGKFYSMCGGYETEAKLRLENEIPEETCRSCGSPFSTHYREPTGSELREQNICHTCHHWNFQLSRPNRIIVNGTKYQDGGSVLKGTPGFLGFGGREWLVQMDDGTIFTTNNLWCQGDIPQRLRKQHPDNAKFL